MVLKMWTCITGDLAEKLKFSLMYFADLELKVVQGDLMFTTDMQEVVHGEKLYTFRPTPSPMVFQ